MVEQKHRTVYFRGVPIEVDYDYYPASKGARERGSGVQLEPDEPACVELTALSIGGVDIDGLLEEHIDAINELCLDGAEDFDKGY